MITASALALGDTRAVSFNGGEKRNWLPLGGRGKSPGKGREGNFWGEGGSLHLDRGLGTQVYTFVKTYQTTNICALRGMETFQGKKY